ncbi:peroxiredoxin [archaeon]|jgi:NADH-dependent peroxiredoxin subunit C|nr:peroxiredoxin [archaeon]MBT3450355.1 peroxiredoxin [archaeon]MBT6868870.1 peroxiredoxin [archaeon]MBT7192909.1 peroxiredoxin [archaeon]MBT7380875.1 peroxiredoxin [archaeon]
MECSNCEPIEINTKAPKFSAEAYQGGQIKKISLDDYKGKWVVLFFYPADFTFVCPTELGDLADKYEELKNMDVEVISVSTDTVFAHKAWADDSPTIAKIKFPMMADPTGNICRDYGTYIYEEGLSLRGTFIIDPDGILKSLEINDNSIGRNSDELLRKIKAAQFVRQNGGEVCPANWQPGEKTLKPGLDLVGKI